jgi:hypothetical protein
LADRAARRKEASDLLKAGGGDQRTVQEQIEDAIDSLGRDNDLDNPIAEIVPKKKAWTKRPENWEDIVDEALNFGDECALKRFQEFRDLPYLMGADSQQRTLTRWKKEFKEKKVIRRLYNLRNICIHANFYQYI